MAFYRSSSGGSNSVKFASGTATAPASTDQYIDIQCTDSSGNTFQPKTIILYAPNVEGAQFFGVHTEDLDSTHTWKNQAGANQNAFMAFPTTSTAGYYCQIKNITSTGFQVWGYINYTFNWIAYG